MKLLLGLFAITAMFGIGEVVEQNTYTNDSVCVSSTCTNTEASELKPLYSDTDEKICMNPQGC